MIVNKNELIDSDAIYRYSVSQHLNNYSDNLSKTMDKLKSGEISVDKLQANLTLDAEHAILKTISELIAKNNELLLLYLKQNNL